MQVDAQLTQLAPNFGSREDVIYTSKEGKEVSGNELWVAMRRFILVVLIFRLSPILHFFTLHARCYVLLFKSSLKVVREALRFSQKRDSMFCSAESSYRKIRDP